MMNDLLNAIEESLINHTRPSYLAFQIYELLGASGYDDTYIHEVASALDDIVT